MKPKLNMIRHAFTTSLLSVASLFALPVFAETFTEGKQVPPTTEKLKPGDFVWEPERAPAAGAHRREQAGADRLRVSEWHPHRAQQREHGTSRASDAGRCL